MKKKIIFTAGGTGGHIFPALAIAKLCVPQYDIAWIGAKNGLENKIIPEHGILIHTVNISGLRGKGLIRKIFLPFLLLRAFFQAFTIILRERPDVIAGFGGYVTFPVCFVAVMLRIPVIIHEQNSVAGLTNKVLAMLVNKIIVAFPDVLPGKKTVLLGNPVRDSIENIAIPQKRYAKREGGLKVSILGGSLGAQIFNELLPEVFALVNENKPGHIAAITHQVGRGDAEVVAKEYAKFGIIKATVVNFIDDMAALYADSDLLICRAGASTVSEICSCGIAAIFVPYPYAVDNHQCYNAQNLVNNKASIMFIQSHLTVAGLAAALINLDRSACADMAGRAKELAIANSSERIKEVITSFIV